MKYFKWVGGNWCGKPYEQIIKVKITEDGKYEMYERLTNSKWIKTSTRNDLPFKNDKKWVEITPIEAFIELI